MATSLLEDKFVVGCEDYENDLRQIIDRKVLDTSFEPNCGSDCAFFSGWRIGLKLYREERIRNNAMFHQKLMHGFGLAPEVFEPINVMRKGELRFGYVTEVCDQIIEYIYDDDRFAPQIDEFRELDGKILNSLRSLVDRRISPGWIQDVTCYNCGITSDGKVVLFDFGARDGDEELGELAFSFAR